MSALLDAINYAGDAIDKPGRAVRGVLAGKNREALAAIPFSDSLGLTDHADRTSGRDLTDHIGLTKKGEGGFAGHAAGFGAELLTDPLSWVGAGAAFKAAPTLGKGITAGAKALTGLDAIDAIRNGAKGAGRFLRSEQGSLGAFPSHWNQGTVPDHLADLWSPEHADLVGKHVFAEPGEIEHLHKTVLGGDLGRASLRGWVSDARAAEGLPPLTPTAGDLHNAGDELARSLGDGDTFEDWRRGGDVNGSDWMRPFFDMARDPAAINRMEDMQAASHYYGGNGYHKINWHLRTGLGERPDQLDGLDQLFAVSQTPQAMSLRRGVGGSAIDAIEKQIGVPLHSPEAVGRSFVDPGVYSTSESSRVAKRFAREHRYEDPRGVVFHHDVPAGKTAAPLVANEREVAFPPGRRVTITDNSRYPAIKADLLSTLLAMTAGGAGLSRLGRPQTAANPPS